MRSTERRSHRTKKKTIALAMKLTAILLLGTFLHVSASGTAQGITLDEKNASLEKVFKAIEKQTGYLFWYNSAVVQNTKKINIQLKNATLEQALQACFEGQPLTYAIVNKTIVVRPKVPEKANETPVLSPIDVKGRVVNDNGVPVDGATVAVKGSNKATSTNSNGEFFLAGVDESAVLVISATNIETTEWKLNGSTQLTITVKVKIEKMEDVTVTVSTGYQTISKDRATGSFEHIDNELLNRRVSTDLLSRLEGIASGVIFNQRRGQNNEPAIGIRGRSTIFANADPLIIIDNFPFYGNINNINPNDIESITILKDAAAASIWGARSGNGVIVVTTKAGKFNRALKISVNSNFTFGQKPDLLYDRDFLNSEHFIEAEQFLFYKGFYDAALNNTTSRPIISPVVEILAKVRAGTLSQNEAEAQINAFKTIDYRNDLGEYFYRNAFSQQHSINLAGGSEKTGYYFSAGYDQNLRVLTGHEFDRITITARNIYTPVKGLEITTGVNYANTKTQQNNNGLGIPGGGKSAYYPYLQLTDDNGVSLPAPKTYRYDYIDTTGTGILLDWKYRPLDELRFMDNKTFVNDIRLNNAIKYELQPLGLTGEIRYQFQKATSTNRELLSEQTFFTRDMINLYTQATGNSVTRPIPLGDILDLLTSELTAQS
ncbi:MAG: TonB-dependent receptor plug domain-containing protein, partial [Chitinophagaceae bacterium]|nr:TonB-dependent receptor plug domain-containing protein [Chitinophagaceae bacterium]